MTPYAYVAEPIDQISGRHPLAVELCNDLYLRGLGFYSPRNAWAFAGGAQATPSVQQVNDTALDNAAAVVAVMPHGARTVGVPMEIGRAKVRGIPVIIVSDKPAFSQGFAVAGAWKHWTEEPTNVAPLLSQLFFQWKPRQANTLRAKWMSIGAVPGEAPRPGMQGDAGYDLVVSVTTRVFIGHQVQVPCDIAVQLPEGMWGLVQGRSSSWKRGLSIKATVLDAGYRGGLWVDCHNISRTVVEIKAGERIAQLIPMPLLPRLQWEEVRELDPSERGTAGYGSTGP